MYPKVVQGIRHACNFNRLRNSQLRLFTCNAPTSSEKHGQFLRDSRHASQMRQPGMLKTLPKIKRRQAFPGGIRILQNAVFSSFKRATRPAVPSCGALLALRRLLLCSDLVVRTRAWHGRGSALSVSGEQAANQRTPATAAEDRWSTIFVNCRLTGKVSNSK
jgi:hypothetical protein